MFPISLLNVLLALVINYYVERFDFRTLHPANELIAFLKKINLVTFQQQINSSKKIHMFFVDFVRTNNNFKKSIRTNQSNQRFSN